MRQILMALMLIVIATPAVAGDMFFKCHGYQILVTENFLGMKSAKHRLRGESAWSSRGGIKVRDNQIVFTSTDGIRIAIDLLPFIYIDGGRGSHKSYADGRETYRCNSTTDRPR